jgi:hypothetical protein
MAKGFLADLDFLPADRRLTEMLKFYEAMPAERKNIKLLVRLISTTYQLQLPQLRSLMSDPDEQVSGPLISFDNYLLYRQKKTRKNIDKFETNLTNLASSKSGILGDGPEKIPSSGNKGAHLGPRNHEIRGN